jgi:GTPase SAR1 family protein
MASDGASNKDMAAAMYEFSATGTLSTGVTKEALADYVKQETKRSKAIDRQLIQEQSKHKTEIVILLLGTGESGKSTVAKQFRLINHNEYNQAELELFVAIIHSNVLNAVRSGLRFAEENGIELKSVKSEASQLLQLESAVLTTEVGMRVKKVWESEDFQQKVVSNGEFHLDDGALYLMGHLDRVSAKNYVPTSQDILHARQKSTGIVETQFESNGALFRIVDVGGQRSERKKWSVLFSDITGIIFCADVSCYDTPLREDPDVNRMIDSLATFQTICANRDLQSRDIILFLNKTDLLQKKIKRSPFPTESFPGAPTDPSSDDALRYIQSLYLAKNANPNKFIYVHHTIATDTSNIKAVFTDIVKEIVRKDNVMASF